jgi:hypothetical protein
VLQVSRTRFGSRAFHIQAVLSALLAVSLVSGSAGARRGGIISAECLGCHVDEGAGVDITASPAVFEPGDDVTFTVSVRRLSGTAAVGGVSIGLPAIGETHTIAGEGLTLAQNAGLTHSQPKQASGGVATFRFGWRAPAEPGGVVFDVAALAGDGNGRPSGDVAGGARFLATFGCEPVVLYADLDRDGFGTDLFLTSIGCVSAPPPDGYSTSPDDCNDNDQAIYPAAVEKCNRRDDDCDGETDEDAELVELWPDADGDGYYESKTGTPVIGCSGMKGYGAEPGDCAPNDPAINAGATETCNLIDDNCDGRADERTRPQCGVGYCRRESYDCDAAHCTAGAPRAERCNYLDDDCNGEVDDGEPCELGSACLAGKCVVTGMAAGGAGGAMSGGGTSGSGAGSTGTGGVAGTGVSAGGATSGAAGGASGSSASGSAGSKTGGRDTSAVPNRDSGCSLGSGRSTKHAVGTGLLALLAILLRTRRRVGQRAQTRNDRP